MFIRLSISKQRFHSLISPHSAGNFKITSSLDAVNYQRHSKNTRI